MREEEFDKSVLEDTCKDFAVAIEKTVKEKAYKHLREKCEKYEKALRDLNTIAPSYFASEEHYNWYKGILDRVLKDKGIAKEALDEDDQKR